MVPRGRCHAPGLLLGDPYAGRHVLRIRGPPCPALTYHMLPPGRCRCDLPTMDLHWYCSATCLRARYAVS
eukprot:1310468-Rhodomonas_salina.1